MLDYLYSPQPGSQLNEGAFIDKTFATHAQDVVSYSGKLSGHSASPQLRVDFPYRTTVHDDSFNSTDVQRNLFDEVAREDHYGLFDMNSNTCYFTPKKKSITQYVNNMESYTPSKIIGPEHGYVEQDQMDLNDYSPSPTLSSSSYSSQDEPGHGRDVNVDPFSFTFSGLNNGRSSLAAHISSKFDDIVVHHTNTIDNATFGSSSKDRYKTELCRSWAETGYCRYGEKCQFAHGQPELRQVSRHHKVTATFSLILILIVQK
jgi:hypothetical protein